MTDNSRHFSKYAIARSAIRADLLVFGLPALSVFTAGLIVSGRDGYNGLLRASWNLATRPQDWHLVSSWNIVGLALFAVGLTIAIIAAFTLGRFYSASLVTRVDHRLIRHGLYRFVRHPLYFGVLIAIFGIPVFAPSFYGFLVMSALIPIFLIRIRMEERLLTEEFGDEYRKYRKSTCKLIPFIY